MEDLFVIESYWNY